MMEFICRWEFWLFIAGLYAALSVIWRIRGKNVFLVRLDRQGVSFDWDGPFDTPGHGLRFVLSFGEWVRPFTRVKWIKWRGLPIPRMDGNPWTDSESTLLRSFIPLPGFFISYEHKAGWGFYFGTKAFDSEGKICIPIKDWGRQMLCPSLSPRRTADR
jgi:hypothetical protein